MVIFLFALAEMIEALSLDRARNAVKGLMAMTPELALVQGDDGAWREIAARKVALNAVVRIKPGERIPLDGKIVEGQTSINQAPITGESIPVAKQPGDPVSASGHWPMIAAPITASDIKKFILSEKLRSATQPFLSVSRPPVTIVSNASAITGHEVS